MNIVNIISQKLIINNVRVYFNMFLGSIIPYIIKNASEEKLIPQRTFLDYIS